MSDNRDAIEAEYRNSIIDGMEVLLDSIYLNMSKVDHDTEHLFVTELINAENVLRRLNEQLNEYCNASNNVAMRDEQDGYVEFPDDDLE